MKKSSSTKGVIGITIIFIIALSFAIAAIITLFWSKASLSVSYLKRAQAINYAEAALYEAFNRFRIGHSSWDQWLSPTNLAPADPTITIDGVVVTIDVVVNDMGTPADPSDDRDEVTATLDQETITL